MNKILSETKEAKNWISQFDEEDRDIARLILDSLIYVPYENLISGLIQLLKNYIDKHQNEYIALFAVKEKLDKTEYWDDGRKILNITERDGIGSEAIISHFCRDISKTEEYLLDHPDIKTLKDKKCKYIICVNDIIGSGDQSNKFCNWLYEHPTIKSWVSLKYIYINVISFAGTNKGIEYLKKNKIISEVFVNQDIDNGRSLWTVKDRQKIEYVCKKYSVNIIEEKRFPLGYKDMFTFLYFSYKCPNTSPAILWAPSSKKWKSIFISRPDTIIESIYTLKHDNIKMIIDYFKLSKSILFLKFDKETKIMVLILNCFFQKYFKKINIGELLGMSNITVNKYIEKLYKLNLIDKNNKVTKMGKSLIRSAKKAKIIKKELDLKETFYYPSQLRGPIGSSS
jgi:hypothetical protein